MGTGFLIFLNAVRLVSAILPRTNGVRQMLSRRAFLSLGIATGATVAGGGIVWSACASAVAAARARVATGSVLARTRHGAMEYAVAGEGPPILMIHGTGGGFDQGLSFTHGLIATGYRVIAPSRFGYLRSVLPDDPSSENQADAFVDLLDWLGVETVPVIGGSAGALSATAFAIRHPKRCAALVALVPASYAPDRSLAPPPGALTEFIINRGLHSDFLFWLGLNTAESAMTGALLATDPALVAAASPEEQARAHGILWDILPVSARADGLLNDARLAGNPAPMPLDTIRVPTLAISLEDDRFDTVAAARHIAAEVPNAKLVTWPTGGHIYVGHDADVTAEIDAFLRTV
jgi:2-hydroxy-6-oxonona-2,4-dienedioate hydrolase